MASLLFQILRNLTERLDEDLLPGLYGVTSLTTAAVQREFREAELPFTDPVNGTFPPEEELEDNLRLHCWSSTILCRRAPRSLS